MRQVQNPDVKSENICGKPVFTFDSHHEALLPWAECALAVGDAPRLRLLTFDYHSDTRPAFITHSTVDIANAMDDEGWEERAAAEVAKIDYREVETVRDAVVNLRFDEHISAAVQSRIIDIAFAIVGGLITNEYQSNEQNAAEAEWSERHKHTPWEPKPKAPPPYTYSIPKERIIELPRQKVSSSDQPRSKGTQIRRWNPTFFADTLSSSKPSPSPPASRACLKHRSFSTSTLITSTLGSRFSLPTTIFFMSSFAELRSSPLRVSRNA